jgi:hypothetical protein
MEEQNPEHGRKNGNSTLRLLMRGGAFIASWWLTRLSYRRAVRQEVDQLRGELREQLQRLNELETALARVTGNTANAAIPEAVVAAPAAAEAAAAISAREAAARAEEPEITPERMALIAAVVTAFLGRKVKIHQARLVNPEVVSPWAQQGRVFVQASHALARH